MIEHDLVSVAQGTFVMGTDEPYRYQGDGEGPAREIALGPYHISRHPVTNAQFGRVVDDTNHITEAERFDWSFVFHLFLPDDFPDTRGVAATPWWRQVYGADWAHPAGPQSNLEGLADHPVVHVSWNDATAYWFHRPARPHVLEVRAANDRYLSTRGRSCDLSTGCLENGSPRIVRASDLDCHRESVTVRTC